MMQAVEVIDMTSKAQELAPDIQKEKIKWVEIFPGGCHWSYRVARGTTLRFNDLEGGANASVLLYRADEKHERLNIPDTLKAQHTAHLTQGHVLYSDMGRILASIPYDTVGWHDPLCGVSDAALVEKKFGMHRYQENRNGMFRNGKDSLLIEMGKWGLSLRDWVPNLNLFSKVTVNEAGQFAFNPEHSKKFSAVELRMEMDVIIAISTAPHPFDTDPVYAPKKIAVIAWESGVAGLDDSCRLSCAENQRGYYNTELNYR